jgi:hypothetical protein
MRYQARADEAKMVPDNFFSGKPQFSWGLKKELQVRLGKHNQRKK